jgi:hypothetical protein
MRHGARPFPFVVLCTVLGVGQAGVGRAQDNRGAFFSAWTWDGPYRTSPVVTQRYNRLDAQQDRQHFNDGGWGINATIDGINVRDFAAANPGKLYIFGDEPNGAGTYTAEDYATHYHTFVMCMWYGDYGAYPDGCAGQPAVDPTARIAPAGFSELNAAGDADFGIPYADAFYWSYYWRWGPPPVAEWTFHNLALTERGFWASDEFMPRWESNVRSVADWAANHGAPMVLGSWSLDVDGGLAANGDITYLSRLHEAQQWLAANPKIGLTRYLVYDAESPDHPLAHPDGSLTAEGETFTGLCAGSCIGQPRGRLCGSDCSAICSGGGRCLF